MLVSVKYWNENAGRKLGFKKLIALKNQISESAKNEIERCDTTHDSAYLIDMEADHKYALGLVCKAIQYCEKGDFIALTAELRDVNILLSRSAILNIENRLTADAILNNLLAIQVSAG